jgi:hypothetical protein
MSYRAPPLHQINVRASRIDQRPEYPNVLKEFE